MTEKNDKTQEDQREEKDWVWVKDRAGNRFMCHIKALKDPKKLAKEDLATCMNVGKASPKFKD